MRAAGTQLAADGTHEETYLMLARRFRHILAWSSIASTILQLALATVVAAASGGGDFPLR